ncbi:MAG: DNA methyltransferase, partial [Candidatus Micrarchaeia archaeon]
LDNCRIPFKQDDTPQGGYGTMGIGIGHPGEHQPYIPKKDRVLIHNAPAGTFAGGEQDRGSIKDYRENTKGRFPANLLVSDNALDIESKGALAPVKTGQKGFGGTIYGKYNTAGDDGKTFYSDKEADKALSRYFSLDAWWEQKVKELPNEMQKIFPFLYVPKASKSERNNGLDNLPKKQIDFDSLTRTNKETADKFGAERKAQMQNHHPTVKPIKLMSYLIALTTREGDVVLDPFIGSGTTAISALLLNRKFIGFEREPEYFRIAEERIKYSQAQMGLLNHMEEVKHGKRRV